MLLSDLNTMIRAAVRVPVGNTPEFNQIEARIHAAVDSMAKPFKHLDDLMQVHRSRAEQHVKLDRHVLLENVWTGVRARLWGSIAKLDAKVSDYMTVPTGEARREVVGACASLASEVFLLASLVGHEPIELVYRMELELRARAGEALWHLPALGSVSTQQEQHLQELRTELARERVRADRLDMELRRMKSQSNY